MRTYQLFILCLLVVPYGCKQPQKLGRPTNNNLSAEPDSITKLAYDERAGKGALLLTRFKSLSEFKEVITIQYAKDSRDTDGRRRGKSEVTLEYSSGGITITSVLKAGISQADFLKVRNGPLWGKMLLGLKCPYALIHKRKLTGIEHLSRRRPPLFGKGDVAFYDLAETMVSQISEEDFLDMSAPAIQIPITMPKRNFLFCFICHQLQYL